MHAFYCVVIKEEIGTDHDAWDIESAVSFSMWIPFYPNTRFMQKVVLCVSRYVGLLKVGV